MDRVIYTAMTSASQSLANQGLISHNLANVSTPGFKAQLQALQAVPVQGDSLPSRAMVSLSTSGFDSTNGPLNYTGRSLDVALPENSWLAVQLPEGEEVYTHNGAIEVDQNGLLTIQGHPVVGDGGLITVPLQSQVSIGNDGTISVLGAGDAPTTIGQIGRLKRVTATPDELQRGDEGLFHLTEQTKTARGNVLADDPNIKIVSGVLEGSNVNASSTLVDLISNARLFEMQMKTIQTADENAQQANQLLSLS